MSYKNSGLLIPLIERKIIRLPLHHWIRWYDMYMALSAGKSRKNGAREIVIGFFTCYYEDHPEVEMTISYGAFDKMLNFMRKRMYED